MCVKCNKLLAEFLANEKLPTPHKYVYVMIEYKDGTPVPFCVVDTKTAAALLMDDRPADTCSYLTVPVVGKHQPDSVYEVLIHQPLKPSGCPGTFVAVSNDQTMAHRMLAHFRHRQKRWWRRLSRHFTMLSSR
jgi:hypothetical protein